jgi:hypothetical protein
MAAWNYMMETKQEHFVADGMASLQLHDNGEPGAINE